MATSVTDTTSTTSTTGSGTVTNPSSNLSGDDFLQLLITELRYQDPTSPMDTESMLSQTSQLAALQTQENTNALMKKLTEQLTEQASNASNTYAISAIGKMADMGNVELAVDNKTSKLSYELYFEKPVKSGTITIKDSDDKVVNTYNIEEGKSGTETYVWDLKNSSGGTASAGKYTVSAKYTDEDGVEHETKLGKFPVEAVKFVDGVAQLKLGSKYIPMSDIKEFSEG